MNMTKARVNEGKAQANEGLDISRIYKNEIVEEDGRFTRLILEDELGYDRYVLLNDIELIETEEIQGMKTDRDRLFYVFTAPLLGHPEGRAEEVCWAFDFKEFLSNGDPEWGGDVFTGREWEEYKQEVDENPLQSCLETFSFADYKTVAITLL